MLKKKKIAARYASVFLAQSIQSGTLTTTNSDLSFLQSQFTDHPTLDSLLNNPTIPGYEKERLLQKICNQALSPIVWQFLKIIIDQHQIGLLKEILTAFFIAYRAHIGIQSATLTTAVALPAALTKRLKEEVKQWVPCKEVLLTQRIDPSIIGGYILEMDALKLDRSIKHHLHRLQSTLHFTD